MIRVDGMEILINDFPDRTKKFTLEGYPTGEVAWHYSCDEEVSDMMMIMGHLKTKFPEVKFWLVMPYIPNARMDRTKTEEEVFMLKYFCDFINSLEFAEVRVLDAHSQVALDLINNVKEYTFIDCLLWSEDDIVMFPDKGAAARYEKHIPDYVQVIYGNKVRNWKTGRIEGLTIENPNKVDLQGKEIIIVDDICSYGGTFVKAMDALRGLGVESVSLIVAHCENSIHKGKVLDHPLFRGLITTDSLLTLGNYKLMIEEIDNIM